MRIFPVFFSIFVLTSNGFAQGKQQAKAIEVAAGQSFTISLEANATTGYQWQIAKPLDEGALQLTSSDYLPEKTGLTGSGGKQVWVFKALKAGRSGIAFQYVRPWEKGIPPEKEASFVIVIK